MEKKLRGSLIRLMLILLLTIVISVAGLFYSSLQSVFVNQMQELSDSQINQIASTYDLVMTQVSDQIFKYSAFHEDLLDAVMLQERERTASINLYKIMDSIVLGNKYLHSVYLYIPAQGRIFTSDRGASYEPENFYDPAVGLALERDDQRIVDPRVVRMASGDSYLLSSIILPLPVKGNQINCTLVANINVQALYNDIISGAAVSDHNVYVYHEDGTILISGDPASAYRSIEEVREPEARQSTLYWMKALLLQNATIQSDAYSPSLGWHFYLKTSIRYSPARLIDNSIWLVVIIFIAGFGAFISYHVVKVSSHPLQNVIGALNEKLLRDLLTGGGGDNEEILDQLRSLNQSFPYRRFLVAMIEVADSDCNIQPHVLAAIEEQKDLTADFSIRILGLRDSSCVMIINYNRTGRPQEMEQTIEAWLRGIYESIAGHYGSHTYLFAGRSRGDVSQLASAYQACVFLGERKLTASSRFSVFQDVKPLETAAEYPAHLENQLVNNLLTGNDDGCRFYEEKFFAWLLRPENGMTDTQIRSGVYQLQNAVLKRVTSLPISVRIPGAGSLDGMASVKEIRAWFSEFLQAVLEEINKKNAHDESVLITNILEYIDDNLLSDDFNLNSLSYRFDLNRNYLAKMIKEQTGYSFNDYVNRKKVSMARALLSDSALTVEMVAHRCGFRYAHYFIKIFKGIEGVTPGQYRDTLGSRSSAREYEAK